MIKKILILIELEENNQQINLNQQNLNQLKNQLKNLKQMKK